MNLRDAVLVHTRLLADVSRISESETALLGTKASAVAASRVRPYLTTLLRTFLRTFLTTNIFERVSFVDSYAREGVVVERLAWFVFFLSHVKRRASVSLSERAASSSSLFVLQHGVLCRVCVMFTEMRTNPLGRRLKA